MEPIKRVLVVDDDRDIRTIIEETLVAGGYDVDTATDSGMALRKIETTHYDLAIVDLMLPDIDGVMLQGKIRVEDPELSRFSVDALAVQLADLHVTRAAGLVQTERMDRRLRVADRLRRVFCVAMGATL